MARDRVWNRVEQEILRLCYAGLDTHALPNEVLQRLRRIIPVDAWFWATVDPATLLFTGSITEEIPEQATPAFLTNEFLEDDVNKFAHLARDRHSVGALYEATSGEPLRSPRFREILAPIGLGDELRAAMRVGSTTWGVVCLHRELGSPGFTPEESAFLDRLAPHLAQGLRSSLLIDRGEMTAAEDGPGLLMLADDLSVAASTPAADAWLAELGDWPLRTRPPHAVQAVAAQLRTLERAGQARPDLIPRARVRTRSGRWLVLHAVRLSGTSGEEGQIAVVLQPARPVEVAPLILAAYGLTERETKVAELVLQGMATTELADRLFISPQTVQQHLKAVFEKTGVRSRRELVAHVFSDQYWPRILAGSELGADGWFAAE